MLSKVSEQVTPILDALYGYGTSGRYKGTRVQTLAMEQFNRAQNFRNAQNQSQLPKNYFLASAIGTHSVWKVPSISTRL